MKNVHCFVSNNNSNLDLDHLKPSAANDSILRKPKTSNKKCYRTKNSRKKNYIYQKAFRAYYAKHDYVPCYYIKYCIVTDLICEKV